MASGSAPAASGIRALPESLRARYRRWIDRRIPRSREITLTQRRLFIFPTRTGFFFGLCLLVMLLTAINYQNNMSFALTFLLANVFVVAVLHTYANLAGLTVRALRARPVFSGQLAGFELQLQAGRGRQHVAVRLAWPGSEEQVVSLAPGAARAVSLYLQTSGRGWFRPGRLLLESTYPLGLLRCWTWIDLDIRVLVYPRPLASGPLPGLAGSRPDGAVQPVHGDDDFYGFRGYRAGDPLKQVHWKGLARSGVLSSKMYTAYADRSVWLDWEMFRGLGTEQTLSHLCYWALQFENRNEEYGLRLPGQVVPPDVGDSHRDQVLRALALFGVES